MRHNVESSNPSLNESRVLWSGAVTTTFVGIQFGILVTPFVWLESEV
jgi:hypothetical protein